MLSLDRSLLIGLAGVAGVLAYAGQVGAQDVPPPAEPAPTQPAPAQPEPAEPAPTEPAPAQPAPAQPAPDAQPEPSEPAPAADTPLSPPPPPDDAPATEEAAADTEGASDEADPSLSVGLGLRAGLALDFTDETVLNTDQINVRPYFGGQFNDWLKFEGNLDGGTGGISVLDAVVKLELHDYFHLWVGQFLPPSSRANLSGPYYQNHWLFPTGVHVFPAKYAGRDRGVALFGQIAGGVFKWQVGLFELDNVPELKNSRVAARVVANLLDPEPGYYNSSTYYGDKNVAAIGVTLHYENGPGADVDDDGTIDTEDDNLMMLEIDGLFEYKLQPGVLSVEGTAFLAGGTDREYGRSITFNAPPMGNASMFDESGNSFAGLVAFLVQNAVGPGQLQPNARIQFLDVEDLPDAITTIDVGLNYIIDGHNARASLIYRHVENAIVGAMQDSSDSVHAGMQLQVW